MCEMQRVGRGDVRRVEGVAAGGLFQIGEGVFHAVASSEGRGSVLPPGIDGRVDETRVEVRPAEHRLDDGAGADGQKPHRTVFIGGRGHSAR